MAFENLLVADPMHEAGHRFDIGRIAEDLIFYEKVHVHAGRSELGELISRIGFDSLVDLMSRGFIKLAYANNFVCARTHMDGVIALYEPVVITAEKFALEPTVHEILRENGQSNSKHIQRFLDLIEEHPHDVRICDATRSFLDDADAVEQSVQAVIAVGGGLPEGHPVLRFRPSRQDGGRFTVETNIDFAMLNAKCGQVRGPLDPARLIAFLASAYSKLFLASARSADFETNPFDSILLSEQLNAALARRNQAADSFYQLQRVALGNGNAIADAINSGERSFRDLISILERAQKFRDWLRSESAQVDLVHKFYVKSTEDSWISKLPAKTFRWLIATTGGAAIAGTTGLIAGAVVGALDTFLVDKVFGGWKPHHFVNGELKEFSGIGKGHPSG